VKIKFTGQKKMRYLKIVGGKKLKGSWGNSGRQRIPTLPGNGIAKYYPIREYILGISQML